MSPENSPQKKPKKLRLSEARRTRASKYDNSENPGNPGNPELAEIRREQIRELREKGLNARQIEKALHQKILEEFRDM